MKKRKFHKVLRKSVKIKGAFNYEKRWKESL